MLVRDDWDNVVRAFSSKNRQQIRTVIERCLDLIVQGMDAKQALESI